MDNLNYKTFIPAIVGVGALMYEAYTGHELDKSVIPNIANGLITAIGVILTIVGVVKNHEKAKVQEQPVQPDASKETTQETQVTEQETPVVNPDGPNVGLLQGTTTVQVGVSETTPIGPTVDASKVIIPEVGEPNQ